MSEKTTDQLLEILAWIKDRQAYRRYCGKRDGSAYSDECKVENDALYELQIRGVI